MKQFIWDLLAFPRQTATQKTHNRRYILLIFLFKDYPVFFWAKPRLWKIIIMPLLIVMIIRKGIPTSGDKPSTKSV